MKLQFKIPKTQKKAIVNLVGKYNLFFKLHEK